MIGSLCINSWSLESFVKPRARYRALKHKKYLAKNQISLCILFKNPLSYVFIKTCCFIVLREKDRWSRNRSTINKISHRSFSSGAFERPLLCSNSDEPLFVLNPSTNEPVGLVIIWKMGFLMKYKGKFVSGRGFIWGLAFECGAFSFTKESRDREFIQREPITLGVLCNKKTCARRKFRCDKCHMGLALGSSTKSHGVEVV